MSLEGIWLARGYGRVLEVDGDGYTIWEIVGWGAYVAERGSRDELERGFERIHVDGDRLSLDEIGGVTRTFYDRVPELLEECVRGVEEGTDPERNFEVLASLFAQHYPFFELRGVDWEDSCRQQRPQVRPETTDDELFAIFCSMLTPLRDNHVALVAGERVFAGDKTPALRARIRRQLGIERTQGAAAETERRLRRLVAAQPLPGTGAAAANGRVHWGRLRPDLGYVALLGLSGFAAEAVPPSLPAADRHARRQAERLDLAALDSVLDDVLRELQDSRDVVLDLRACGDGSERLALAVAGRFADRARLAMIKRARMGQGWAPDQEIYLEPSGAVACAAPLYLLTSSCTVGAGEMLALALASRSAVTRVGETTLGCLSGRLSKRLPNGWQVDVPNEVCSAADGTLFEGAGIPPQAEVAVWLEEDPERGWRLAIDRVLELTAR